MQPPEPDPNPHGPPSGAGPETNGASADVKQAVLDGVGGPMGMVYTALPVVLFAAITGFTALPVAIGVAVAAAVLLAVFRMWRGEKFGAATGGVIGVAAAGAVSAATGSAADFFLIGIWAALVLGLATLATLVARRPVTGMIWNAMHGGSHDWRADRPVLLAHDLATGTVAAVFAARYISQEWFYRADSTTGLAIADTVTGFPLAAVAAVVIVWAWRKSTKRLTTTTAADPAHD
ncbi:DUF3159 domain-containing protein [Nocardiopsis coralliicola]